MYKKEVMRRGEAAVIGTVLLIVTVLVSGSIVAYYTIQQAKSVDASCFEALNSIQFQDIEYSCRMLDAPGGPLTSFSLRIADDKLEGFQLGLKRGGTTDTYEIRAGAVNPDVCLLDSGFGQPLAIPSPGDTLTYVLRGDFEEVFVAPILKGGKGCYAEARKDVAIENKCVNPEVESRLVTCFNGASIPLCGNGAIDSGEQCDGANLAGESCTTRGYVGGILGCYPQGSPNACTFNVGSCQLPPEPTISGVGWEQTSAVQGEQVNFHLTGTGINGLPLEIEIWEDDGLLGDDLVSTMNDRTGGSDGVPLIVSLPAPWQCDILFGFICQAFSEFYIKARIAGSPSSEIESYNTLVVGEASGTCGNQVVQPGEECDPPESVCSAAYGSSCTYCAGSCLYDVIQGPSCGDGTINGPEVCDGTNVGSQTCNSQGFTNGNLGCAANCLSFDTSACQTQTCGNGVREGTEQCDGSDLAGQSCTSLGSAGTGLSCSGSCTFNTGTCTTSGGGTPGGGVGVEQ